MPWLFQRHCQERDPRPGATRPVAAGSAASSPSPAWAAGSAGSVCRAGCAPAHWPQHDGLQEGQLTLPLQSPGRRYGIAGLQPIIDQDAALHQPARPQARARFGRRPIAAITRSCSLTRPSVRVTRQPSPAGHLSWRDRPELQADPWLRSACCSGWVRVAGSRALSGLSARSTRVTSFPSLAMSIASSQPMSPPQHPGCGGPGAVAPRWRRTPAGC